VCAKFKPTRNEKQLILNELWNQDKWPEFREFLLNWLVEKPDDHWIFRILLKYITRKNSLRKPWNMPKELLNLLLAARWAPGNTRKPWIESVDMMKQPYYIKS
jgi:hypothetical protein